jgi:leader peptidase (prepilin peptidase)/N-methyltransferase
MQKLIYIAIILFLIKISYIDYKRKIIPDKLNLILALFGIFNLIINFQNCKVYIASAAITFTVFLLLAIITDGGIGGGDIKLLTALSLIFETNILTVITITFTVATIFSMLKLFLKQMSVKENVPLAPFVCLSVIMVVIIKL